MHKLAISSACNFIDFEKKKIIKPFDESCMRNGIWVCGQSRPIRDTFMLMQINLLLSCYKRIVLNARKFMLSQVYQRNHKNRNFFVVNLDSVDSVECNWNFCDEWLLVSNNLRRRAHDESWNIFAGVLLALKSFYSLIRQKLKRIE